jgi:hypothetical protein
MTGCSKWAVRILALCERTVTRRSERARTKVQLFAPAIARLPDSSQALERSHAMTRAACCILERAQVSRD